jgi:hypothetical protein
MNHTGWNTYIQNKNEVTEQSELHNVLQLCNLLNPCGFQVGLNKVVIILVPKFLKLQVHYSHITDSQLYQLTIIFPHQGLGSSLLQKCRKGYNIRPKVIRPFPRPYASNSYVHRVIPTST